MGQLILNDFYLKLVYEKLLILVNFNSAEYYKNIYLLLKLIIPITRIISLNGGFCVNPTKWGLSNLIVVLGLYLLFSVIIFPNFEYIINSDGISYINIATNYLNGHIFQAINGYWSPLYSWLLVPFIYIWPGNLENVISTKILSIIIGLFTFIAISSILTKLSMDNYQKTITLLALLPFMLYFTFNYISPDFLVVCTLLYYMNFLMDERYRKTWLMGILTGFLGVMAFLAKSYVFFFFLIHFMVVNLFYVEKFSRDRKTIQKKLFIGVIRIFSY